MVGLYNRGACGGAVRGVVCGSLSAAGAPALEAVVRKIHRHFTGNPRFEKLPKKFKIAVEADTQSGRHLIQDVGLVAVASDDGRLRFDAYVAGGLGREPVPGFLLAPGVPEEALLALIEKILRVYEERTPAGKRLKFLVREMGKEEFARLVLDDPAVREELPTAPSLTASLVPPPLGARLTAHVFAGELKSEGLLALSEIARSYCGGVLMVTGDQDVVLHAQKESDAMLAQAALGEAGFGGREASDRLVFRVCPGNHECIMGLAATRDVAAEVAKRMGEGALSLSWAFSGCPNCCAQPQLAEAGIVASRLAADPVGRTPRFDLYRKGEGPFAAAVRQGLTLQELLEAVGEI